MTTSRTSQIAAEQQRQRIPTPYLMDFEEITNGELGSMARDDLCPKDWRIYAGWELDYREASGIDVVYDTDTDSLKRKRANR